MLFHSNIFIFYFFPILFLIFFFSEKIKLDRKILFIFASLIFYSWWNIYYLPLIILSIFINYFLGLKIQKSDTNKKIFLIFAIILNILFLFTFKYADFFIQNYNFLFSQSISNFNLPFPLGISFYTFQIITYLVDCYYGEIKSNKIKNFALFVVFFPQLIAGPIIKHNFLINQLDVAKKELLKINNILKGLILFIIGFIKKVFIADQLSIIVENGFSNPEILNFFQSWITSLCFTFQIYFDFSGYVDMALGCALLLNISLPKNFNSPYKANNIINFWSRWHITLADFLMNYIYYPILKSRPRISFNFSMLITIFVFIIAGLWHGPSWMFVTFGLLHGTGVVFNHYFAKFFDLKIPKFISIFLTFNYVNLTFIFFRSNNFEQAMTLINSMISLKSFNLDYFNDIFNNFDLIKTISLLVLSFIIIFCFKNSDEIVNSNYLNKS